MEHNTSPIDNHQNRTRTCRIVKETNAEIKARLPCTVYVVISTDVETELGRRGIRGVGEGAAPVRGKGVHGSFLIEAPAVERARAVAQEIADGIAGGTMVDMGSQAGMIRAFMVRGRPGIATLVEVNRDDGQVS